MIFKLIPNLSAISKSKLNVCGGWVFWLTCINSLLLLCFFKATDTPYVLAVNHTMRALLLWNLHSVDKYSTVQIQTVNQRYSSDVLT